MKEGESEGSEWDGSRIDSQVSERELTRGQREEEGGGKQQTSGKVLGKERREKDKK